MTGSPCLGIQGWEEFQTVAVVLVLEWKMTQKSLAQLEESWTRKEHLAELLQLLMVTEMEISEHCFNSMLSSQILAQTPEEQQCLMSC